MAKAIYGLIRDTQLAQFTDEVGLTASSVFKAKSGRWVIRGATGAFSAAAGAADEALIGTIEFVGTASSTAKATKVTIQIANIPVEMPIYKSAAVDGSVTQAQLDAAIGTTCGLKKVADVQYADIDNTTPGQQVLMVVGGDVVEKTLYCIKNPTFAAVKGGTALVETVDVL